jgi:Xaa-Pro aminopeptidase
MSFYQCRLGRLREAMRQWGADLIFFNPGPDLTYISGLLTPMYYPILKMAGDWITGLILGLDKDPVLILQENFAVDHVESRTWIQDIRVLPEGKEPDAYLSEIVAEFEPNGKTIAVSKMLWGQTLLSLQSAAPGARFIPATNEMMDRVRSIKDEQELRFMERAAEITDQVFAATLKALRVGMTERDVATEVVYQIGRHGGDGYSFYPGIICVGNDSDPDRHIMTRNTKVVLAPGTTVAFDFGVLYKGYCSDFGRSVFVGEPRPDALAAYRSITAASQAAMARMADGQVTPAQVCDFVRDRVTADGFGPWYYYLGLGHAIGLEVHEWPWLRPECTETIRAGMCFTVEPKVWKPGKFYVRCEDVVVVDQERARSLTRFDYEPIVVG